MPHMASVRGGSLAHVRSGAVRSILANLGQAAGQSKNKHLLYHNMVLPVGRPVFKVLPKYAARCAKPQFWFTLCMSRCSISL